MAPGAARSATGSWAWSRVESILIQASWRTWRPSVEPEWTDIEVVGVAEDAQTTEGAGETEAVGGAEVAVADTVEFSLRSFTPMLIKFVRLLPASTAGFDSRARILGRRAGGYRSRSAYLQASRARWSSILAPRPKSERQRSPRLAESIS